MRTVRVSWKKIVVALCILIPIIYYLLPKLTGGVNIVTIRKKGIRKPVLHEKSVLGNFEKEEVIRTGPGENGKAHRLKDEQKTEEQRLKGRYFISILKEELMSKNNMGSNDLSIYCICSTCSDIRRETYQ